MRKHKVSCQRCPWSYFGDTLAAVNAYEAHLNDVHCGLGSIGRLPVDHQRARNMAAAFAYSDGDPRNSTKKLGVPT